MADYDFGTPGVRSDRTHTPRQILLSNDGAQYLPTGKIIDGTKARDPLNTGDLDVLRPGQLMGKITTGGKYAPAVYCLSVSATSASFTSITITPAGAVELLRRVGGATGTLIVTGPPSAAGTVASKTATFTAINTSSGAVTVTAVDGTTAFLEGSFIRPTDGSGVIKGILDEHRKVTDVDGTGQDTQLRKLLVSGYVQASQILNYPSDTSLITWLKEQLNAPSVGPGAFKFDDNF